VRVPWLRPTVKPARVLVERYQHMTRSRIL
jgi:hypothetical protein